MKLFRPNMNSKNYFIPIIKLIISISLILICIFRKAIIPIENSVLNVFVAIICFIVGMSCILTLYISCIEIFATYENTHPYNVSVNDVNNCKSIHIDEILLRIDKNHVNEYCIATDNGILLFGSSSNKLPGSSKFFDKKFYCGKQEFDSLDELKKELSNYLIDDCLKVISVDGVKIK